MNHLPTAMEDSLSREISGFHQYILNDPIRLRYVSRHLLAMVDRREEELLDGTSDGYAGLLVHPADRERYDAFLGRLAAAEHTLTCDYRLVKRDGTVIRVRDTAISRRLSDGTLVGSSVLTDITDLKSETESLTFLNDTVPCGFMRYTCEKQPRITYINPTMIELLRVPEERAGELDYLELYKSNIFLMIPMEERRRFSKYLNRVYSEAAPLAGEMTLLRCDGTRAHVFGWVTKSVNENGEAEFQSVCMDVTEQHRAGKDAEAKRYLKALADVYDKIFEFQLDANTVKCLYCDDASSFKALEGIAMQIDDALNKWIISAVDPDDREQVRAFFRDFCCRKLSEPGARPPQLTYRARSSAGEMRRYIGVFIKPEEGVSFYCCRRVREEDAAPSPRTDVPKESAKAAAMPFSDGLAAFELSADGCVKPLYASENVCEFFGYTKEEWLPLTERFTPLETFVAYSEVVYEEFAELLRKGEAEFTYWDFRSEIERRIKAICSQKEPNSRSPRYVMLYAVTDAEPEEKPSLPENRTVSIRTFGYFDVFVGDTPIAFRNKKAKELFALLVDRKGGYVTSEEAISFLWEDEPANPVTLSRYRKVALRLKNTLEEYGISEIMESVGGKRRIVREKVQCDLYDYLSGRAEHAQLFKGSYLTNYSWGETTLGELSSRLE